MKSIDKNIILIFDNIDITDKSFEEIIEECRLNKDFKKLIIKVQFNSNIFGKDYIHKKYFSEFLNVSNVYFDIIRYMNNNFNDDILRFIKNITSRYDYPLKNTVTISFRIFYNNCITAIAKFIIDNNLNIELFLEHFFKNFISFNNVHCWFGSKGEVKGTDKIQKILQHQFKITKFIIDQI